jgi:hypothetical protein
MANLANFDSVTLFLSVSSSSPATAFFTPLKICVSSGAAPTLIDSCWVYVAVLLLDVVVVVAVVAAASFLSSVLLLFAQLINDLTPFFILVQGATLLLLQVKAPIWQVHIYFVFVIIVLCQVVDHAVFAVFFFIIVMQMYGASTGLTDP